MPIEHSRNLAPWIGAAAAAATAIAVVDGTAPAALAAAAVTVLVSAQVWFAAELAVSSPIGTRLMPALAAGLLLVVGYGCGGPSLLALAISVQLAAGLTLAPLEALVVVVLTVAFAGGGRAVQAPQEAWMSGIVLLFIGGMLLRTIVNATSASEVKGMATDPGTSSRDPLTGKTRIELELLKQDFNLLASQLRHEKSSRRSAEEQVLTALRVKEAFLATMSHELRTPLNQIIGYSEILLEDSEAPEVDSNEVQGDISKIHRAAMNLVEIVENVLDQSQLEAGNSSVTPESVNIVELVEKLASSYAAQASQRSNTLRLRCPDDIGEIYTDRKKLHTILKNLLSNACKFTENGTLRLAVERDKSSPTPQVVFSVSDTGIGISPEDMTRLFRPFLQVDGSTTRRFDGAGLGLAVSRQFCTMLHGELLAESTVGSGSTFIVRLPEVWIPAHDAGMLIKSIGV